MQHQSDIREQRGSTERAATPVRAGIRRAIAIASWAIALLCLSGASAQAQPVPATCPAQLGTETLVRHDMSVSFCELCDVGQATIVVENPLSTFPGDVDFSDITVVENLRNTGLTYAGNPQFSFNNAIPTGAFAPTVSGTDDEILTWDLPAGFTLPEVPGFGTSSSITIQFDVERQSSFTEEGLVTSTPDRDIQASVILEPSCAPGEIYGQSTGLNELPLQEPELNLALSGRNLDAAQGGWSDPVYGHEGDDIIWRLRVRNDGEAPLQDFVFDMALFDSVGGPGDFELTHICTTNGAAAAASAGASPANCRSLAGTSSSPNLDIAALFGGGANPYIVLGPNSQRFFYFAGRVNTSCDELDALADNAQWGCQSEPPVGGISQSSTGITDDGTGLLRTESEEARLDFDVDFQGVNDPSQPLGARGNVVVTINNVSRGTIYGDTDGIELQVDLPAQYVVDPSLPPIFDMDPAYGNYQGMIDTMSWDNPDPGTDPDPSADPNAQLNNDSLQFTLTSSSQNAPGGPYPIQEHLIRHGDVVTITIRVVQIDPTYYDLDADLDIRLEDPASTPMPNTDPTQTFGVTGQADVSYEEFCTGNNHLVSDVEFDTANPEDLDVDMTGGELVFILTDSGDPLPLSVELTNNGGHDADDYQAYVTFGQAMQVSTVAPGCTLTTNPPPLPEWQLPDPLPATGTVYICDRGTIGPGDTEVFNFEVVKNPTPPFDDDLTFRADVIGESHLADGTPLWFPVPQPRGDGITDRGNNYTVDGLRARVVGYNLLKTQLGDCNENNPPPGTPDDLVQIGEECTFRVESGGWFGFETPGFTYIAVQNVQVVDQNPDGQTYISSTDPLIESTTQIQGVTFTPPAVPLTDDWFDWTFNTDPLTQRITELDHWFRTNFVTRMMNDPIDAAGAPNQHAATSSNVLTSTFEAVFFNPSIGGEEIFTLGPSTIGFPREVFRRVDVTVTEPQLTLVKEVCNETRYGVGAACTNFVPLADDGDAFDEYVYRITVTNEAAAGGVPRAPAYDVTVTSVTDASDQLEVLALTGDTLDNDGDALVDGADAAGEGTITDTVVENGVPAEVIASYTHSDALLRIDPGDSVVLYYRVDPDDDVAPLQQLISSVSATYDSLEGDFGSQSTPQQPNGDEAGARQYTSAPVEATIQIIPVEVSPKEVISTSSTAVSGPGVDQPAVIGEELEFELQALIPVSQLRNFTIRDELPAGLTCAEAPDVDLDAAPYDAAGFVPGGVFTPTCTANDVIWDFGNQTVTTSNRVDRRFDFRVQFIGRVENVVANQDGVSIVNGGGGTVANVEYINESGGAVVLPIGAATVIVTEPQVDLVKAFSVAQADAGDLTRVTVTATNNGTATAHNIRVLEDLTHPELSYAGDVQGTLPPTADTVTFGPDQPLFTWTPGLTLAPGASVSFSFAVQVGTGVTPHEVLDNTIQADWTSLAANTTALNSTGSIGADGAADGMRIGALPNAADPLNDYESEADASMEVPPLAFTKTDLDPALAAEIGVHKSYELAIQLPEGVTQNVIINDALDAGDVSWVLAHNATYDVTYQFDGISQVNGQPPAEAALLAFPSDGESGTITWNIGEVVTLSEDDLTVNAITPTIRVTYFARINNDTATDAGDSLQNIATTDYTNGETAVTESLVSAAAPIIATESTLTATKVLANVTGGKLPTDPPAFNDLLEYTVTIVNAGIATAYDVNVVDTLPPELTLEVATTPTATLNSVPIAGFVAVPAGSPSGPLIWGNGNGDGSIDIPSGGFVDLTYRIRVTTPLPDPSVLANRVWVDWTSLDGADVHERTGAGCPTTTAPNDYCFGPAVASGTSVPVPPPSAVLKEISQATASVGESFTYRITVPSTPYAFPIYDVRITDDLGASAADLRFVQVDKVSVAGTWTPVNTGTPTALVIEDTTSGIDIPAGEQIVVDVTVVLEDTPTNATGLSFTNAASQTYNWVDGDPLSQRAGFPGVSPPMTIVGPDTMLMDKSGPTQATVGVPVTYTLDVTNTGDGPAFGMTLSDLLPDTVDGGTCDVAPTNFGAGVFESNGTTPVSGPLAEGADFTVTFTPAPTCRVDIAFTGTNAVVGATERLIVTYDAALDLDTSDSAALTNVAGATQWFSAEGADARSYTGALTDGTIGTDDEQDATTVATALPLYRFEKTVINVTTGQDPAVDASPGDTLRYRLEVENLGSVAGSPFTLVDELDALNVAPVFAPGSLTIVSAPGTDGSSATGGANGTGLVSIADLSLPNLGDSLFVEFEATLAPVVAAGTVVTNQGQLVVGGSPFALSDDPNVGAPPDPLVFGDEDPTTVTIQSAPDFLIQKTSAYLDGDPAVLLAGERIQYTITVKNVGSDDAADATLRDAVPAGTTYVPGSTTLNGTAVTDGAGGTSPLATGLLIYAPEDPTPGAMRADDSATTTNVATLVFEVLVDPAAADGTVIANQAFVSAVGGGVVDQPSDDPSTPLADDPTRDVVGNLPLLFASKDVVIVVDGGTVGVADPGDRLRYTIAVQNTGSIPATVAQLVDAVPANTTYVAGSTTLNGLAVPDGAGGTSPLIAGIDIASTSGTPPLPAAGAGVLAPAETATIVFDLDIDAGVASGTIISNQATVQTAELPNLLTDGDGNPSTGPEPTVIVVGDAQVLTISKNVIVVGGGAALAGADLEYEVIVSNPGTLPAQNVIITDDLGLPVPGQLTYVPASATMNGLPAGIAVVGSLITADYSTLNGPLGPGESITLRFRATLDGALAIGTVVSNTATVAWNAPVQTESATVTITVGGMPGAGVLSGALWQDIDFDLVQGGAERALDGWTVELLRSGVVAFTTLTDAAGGWAMSGIQPNDITGEAYAVRFSAPQAVATTASLGNTDSAFTDGPQLISNVLVSSGSVLADLNLPIQPNGVVYDSIERVPIPGTVLQMRNANTGVALPSACFDDPAQQGQVTLADGLYKFDLNFSDPACPSGGGYLIDVTGAATGYSPGLSLVNPPTTDAATAPFDVPGCPGGLGDAVPGTGGVCEIQASENLPPATVAPRTAGSVFHAHLVLDSSLGAFSAQAFNNHIAMDPALDAAVAVTKTTPNTEVVLGQLVPYEITATNQLTTDLLDVVIVDRYPAGFKYVDGSARIDGVAIEPTRSGRELRWPAIDIPPAGKVNLQLILAVGAGVREAEYVNRAQIVSGTGDVPLSGTATATVRVAPDPDFACTDVIGKVFDDHDRDGHQDGAEAGLSGVRLVTPRGLVATTDDHGRFHITCAIVPADGRGSNFVLKLDDRTLPSGYRMSTRAVQVKRATRGKALRFGFGASIDRVVGLDVADAAFEPGGTALRPQWEGRIALLVDELEEDDSTLRISYIGDVESARLVDRRMSALESRVRDAWRERSDAALTIENEIYWRRGAPSDRWSRFVRRLNPWSGDAGVPPNAGEILEASNGQAIERHLPHDSSPGQWMTDPELFDKQRGDRIEQREVMKEEARTVKLRNVVPPIRFDTGEADLPPSYIDNLRRVLDDMQHLSNVRLHFVGHADSQPLSGRLASEYGDNVGLSRERSGEVAEFVQQALDLQPESISFAWAGDSEPVATNSTVEGRALNRRVEVEVWYDEYDEKVAVEDVVVSDDIKRVKVCRVETVCKMRFIEGHNRRARVRNLVPPLRIGDRGLSVPQSFVDEISEALGNLSDHNNVTVKLVGYTDSAPLAGREARIYGTHLALSKANAHRAALAIKDALGLPNAAVASDGRGSSRPVASNESARGRTLNRRIEVEFWYDDPLQELDDDLQICPEALGDTMITKVYDPPWGRIPSLSIEGGEPSIPVDLEGALLRAMNDLDDRQNVRLRFVGYTGNETLDRRTALVYGDDVGLSTARARRSMDAVVALMALESSQAEAEGRGYVHSDDVVNAGFTQEADSLVVVQVVYDEPAASDDYEGVEITRITRELEPQDPLALNLMRITVDGEPVDDRNRSSADVQRCTDVALERAAVEFRFDSLTADRRLSVASDARMVAAGTAGAEAGADAAIRFKAYTNYGHYIERTEVRVFERSASLESKPLAVIEVGPDGIAEWRPEPRNLSGPVEELKFVLRAYSEKGRFDETVPQSLWMVNGTSREMAARAPGSPANAAEIREADKMLRAGYGETDVAIANIDLGGAGTVRVLGGGVPEGHNVWIAGEPVPVAEGGEFIAEAVVPQGLQTVEVAMLDEEGNGELFLRDLEVKKSDWFYVAMADVTLQANLGDGPSEELQGENGTMDPDSFADGRFAFFLTGRFGNDWRLTASADTEEGELKDLFTNFMDKSPDALFRRIDPDYHYPTFGDDGTVDQMAPSSGKFFVKLDQGPNHAMWGNFGVSYVDNELARVERGLYGGNLHYETDATTSFGERRVQVDGFAADPGTISSREDFRGTGGSLYYLKHRDLLMGSERLRIEIRDKVTGLVTAVTYLQPDEDYDIDYFQGRILLAKPISATASDGLLVRNDGLSGNEAWLVAQYEYAPGIDEIDALAAGGEGQFWVNDFLKLGVTAYRNSEQSADSSLYGAHLVARLSSASWMKVQAGYSDGLVGAQLSSNDGGFDFDGTTASSFANDDALAFRGDLSLGLSDVSEALEGGLTFYFQRLYAGYSVPGLSAQNDTDFVGGTLSVPVADRLAVEIKADYVAETDGLVTNTQELDAHFDLTDEITVSAGVRNDEREDDSPAPPATQREGGRTDVIVEAGFDAGAVWSAYAFGQATVRKNGDREDNHRGGVGGRVRINDRLEAEGEVSYGDQGATVEVGTNYQQTAETSRYLSYSLDNERATTGANSRRGNLTSGARTRLSDSASVYQEDRYQHSASANGLSRAIGLDWVVNERWTLGAEWEYGTLIDPQTLAETRRNAGGGRVSYRFEDLYVSSGVEYRSDDTQQPDSSWSKRTTWLFRNDARLQVTDDWRLLGKFNHSFSNSSLGEFFDGGFTELVLGYGYRPVANDKLDVLAKYTYFFNRPTTDQVGQNGQSTLYLQRSHVMSVDVTYDVARDWTLGGKYAYRLGELSLDRENPDFFDNSAHLYVGRVDWQFLSKWEISAEGRMLHMPSLGERKGGALFTLYRYLGKHFKVGVGYNFTDFSEDLTDLSYDHHGLFFNIIGTL